MSPATLSRRNAPLAVKKQAPTSGTGLRISERGDAFEREADHVAEEIIAGGSLRRHWSISNVGTPGPIQRKCACGECAECNARQTLQAKRAAGATHTEALPQLAVLPSSASGRSGEALSRGTRAFFESRMGFDLASVRVHTDDRARHATSAMGARAFTRAQDIYFAPGQFAPDSERGKRLLAHELVHVVQQSGGSSSGALPIHDAGHSLVQRECLPVAACPLAGLELGGGPPWWQMAEDCLRGDYVRNHLTHFVGSGRTWPLMAPPKGTAARRDHDCFKNHLMAKSGMYLAQPDIIDFSSAEIYDVTTLNQERSHRVRILADTGEATGLAAIPDCGSSEPPTMRRWAPGVWNPSSPCYWMAADIFLQAVNVGGGVLTYRVIKDVTKELVGTAAFAAMVALIRKGMSSAATVGVRGARGVGGRALAYANAAALLILLAMPGKAEAKAGPGEMPLETLFKAMAQKGTPVPPEMRKSLEEYVNANPDLKQKLEEGYRSGDLSKSQEELSQRVAQIMSESPDQFSAEDLQLMLDATAASSGSMPASDINAAKLRAALDAKRSGQGGSGQGASSAAGGGTKENVWDRAKGSAERPAPPPATSTTASPQQKPSDSAGSKANVWEKAQVNADPKLDKLSQASRQKLAAAPENVRKLFKAMTAGSEEGAPVTDAILERYLQVVPSDLTVGETQSLLDQLGPLKGQNAEQVVGEIEKALAKIRRGEGAEQGTPDEDQARTPGALDPAAAPSDKSTSASASEQKGQKPTAQTAQEQAEAIRKVAEFVKKSDYATVGIGGMVFTWTRDPKRTEFNGSIRAIDKNGTHLGAFATVRIMKRDPAKRQLVIKIISASALVDASGTVHHRAATFVGKEILAEDISGPKK